MIITARSISSLLLLAFASVPGVAQDSALVRDGARIRVRTSHASAWHTGTLAFVRADSLGVRRCAGCAPEVHRVPLLARIEISRGRSPSVRRGIAGLALGATIGMAIGAARTRSTPDCSADICGLRGAGVARGVRTGAMVGSVAGLAVGLSFGRERWTAVTVISRVALRASIIAPQANGALQPTVARR